MTIPVSRRDFFRQTACAAVGYSALSSTILDLHAMNAAAQDADDYRALVCVFLSGGNDANNVLIPVEAADFAKYTTLRGNLALPSSRLLPLSTRDAHGRPFALHDSLSGLKELFDNGRAAIVRNVGTLVAPITGDEFRAGGAAVPPELFSHYDQQVLWQTSVTDRSERTGWGGRMADLTRSLNGASQVSMLISLAGSNTFQIGSNVYQYPVGPTGSIALDGYTSDPADPETAGIERMIRGQHTHLFENAYDTVMRRAVDADAQIRRAFDAAPPIDVAFPATRLGAQLKTAARMIQIHGDLGQKRQIFFCNAGGYDTHDAQLTDHANLLKELGDALLAFYKATETLGLADKVTAFTASDFGRTFTSNGRGSDHGWGGHHFVTGGAVNGRGFYGDFPLLEIKGPNDTDRGRWIPSTSVDQYAATLARWFGIAASEIPLVLPNIGRFATRDLGFMRL